MRCFVFFRKDRPDARPRPQILFFILHLPLPPVSLPPVLMHYPLVSSSIFHFLRGPLPQKVGHDDAQMVCTGPRCKDPNCLAVDHTDQSFAVMNSRCMPNVEPTVYS